MGERFRTILVDPPWAQQMSGKYSRSRQKRPEKLPYPTMSLEEITALPVADLAGEDAHLWLWTTNQFLRAGFDVMEAWGFKYLAPVVWVKPSGCGNYFVHRTQTLLFGYRGKLKMSKRYSPNLIESPAVRHSKKPEASYEMIEAVSPGPRVELFCRTPRAGWVSFGNEIDGRDIRDVIGGR